MWLCLLSTCTNVSVFLSEQKMQRPQRLIQSPKKRRHQVKVVVMPHNPYTNVYTTLNCFPFFCIQLPLSEVQHESLQRWMKRLSFFCMHEWKYVQVRVCVWKTLSRCQDADPVITASSQGSSVITVPSSSHDGVAAISACKLFVDNSFTALSGCVYFHRMAELLEISIYFLYRNFIIAVFLKLIYVFDLNLRVYSVLFNKIIVLSKPKPKYIWFMIILFLGSRLWFYDYVCNEYEELILWGLFNWF